MDLELGRRSIVEWAEESPEPGATDFVPAPGLDEPENLERSEGTPLAVFHSFSSERSRRNPSSVETLGA